MKNLALLPLLLALLTACSAKTNVQVNRQAPGAPTPIPAPALPPPYLRGINIMDLGQGTIPGTYGVNYTSPALSNLQFLSGRGNQLLRLPIAWERLQTTLGGPLNSTYLGYVLQSLRDAKTAGLQVIVDLHSYGRYNGTPFGAAGAPTSAEFNDVWTRLAAAIEADPDAAASLYAYDLMNEPHDLTGIPGNLSGPVMLSDFEANVSGWNPDFTPAGMAVTQVTRAGQGSARVTAPAQSGGAPTTKYGMRLTGGAAPNSTANGPDLEATIFIPSSVPGTVEAFFVVYGTGYSYNQSTPVNIPRNVATKLQYTPPASELNGSPAYVIGVQVTGGDGTTPIEFYVDQIQQGTLGGALSPVQVWETYSQSVVTALRGAGSTVPVMVEGYAWAAADSWPSVHPTPWITDPLNKVIYEAHQYGDDNASGVYANSFAAETANATGQGFTGVADRYVKRIKHFTDWTTTHGVKGFLGEFGWPNAFYAGSDTANWDAVGEAVMTHMDSVELSGTIWTTGTWIDESTNVMACYELSSSQRALTPAAVFEPHIAH
jgi:hypothetical protein